MNSNKKNRNGIYFKNSSPLCNNKSLVERKRVFSLLTEFNKSDSEVIKLFSNKLKSNYVNFNFLLITKDREILIEKRETSFYLTNILNILTKNKVIESNSKQREKFCKSLEYLYVNEILDFTYFLIQNNIIDLSLEYLFEIWNILKFEINPTKSIFEKFKNNFDVFKEIKNDINIIIKNIINIYKNKSELIQEKKLIFTNILLNCKIDKNHKTFECNAEILKQSLLDYISGTEDDIIDFIQVLDIINNDDGRETQEFVYLKHLPKNYQIKPVFGVIIDDFVLINQVYFDLTFILYIDKSYNEINHLFDKKKIVKLQPQERIYNQFKQYNNSQNKQEFIKILAHCYCNQIIDNNEH